MGEDILDGVSKLEGVYISETVLNVGVNDELGRAKDFSARVEGVSEPGFLSFLCRQGPR